MQLVYLLTSIHIERSIKNEEPQSQQLSVRYFIFTKLQGGPSNRAGIILIFFFLLFYLIFAIY